MEDEEGDSEEREGREVMVLIFSLSLLSSSAVASLRGSFKGGEGTLSMLGTLVLCGCREEGMPRFTAAVGRAAAG